MISTITNRDRLAFLVLGQRFTARVFVGFLRRLIRHAGRKVFLIVDGHPVHQARRVSRWLAQHPAQVRLFWLPPYRPELNPDELLNQAVKSNALGRRRPVDRQELIDNLRSSLRSTPRRPEKVRRYFHERQVRSAA
jgi:transposase